jgi:hypothetical protein
LRIKTGAILALTLLIWCLSFSAWGDNLRRKKVDPLLKTTHYVLRGDPGESRQMMVNAQNLKILTNLLNPHGYKFLPTEQRLTNGITLRSMKDFAGDQISVKVPPGVVVLEKPRKSDRIAVPQPQVYTRAIPAVVGYGAEGQADGDGWILSMNGDNYDGPYVLIAKEVPLPWYDEYLEGLYTLHTATFGLEGDTLRHKARVDYREVESVEDPYVYLQINGETSQIYNFEWEVSQLVDYPTWHFTYEITETETTSQVVLGNDDIGWIPLTDVKASRSYSFYWEQAWAYSPSLQARWSQMWTDRSGETWQLGSNGSWVAARRDDPFNDWCAFYGLRDTTGSRYDGRTFWGACPIETGASETPTFCKWYVDRLGQRVQVWESEHCGGDNAYTRNAPYYGRWRLYDYANGKIVLWAFSDYESTGNNIDSVPGSAHYGVLRESASGRRSMEITRFPLDTIFSHQISPVALWDRRIMFAEKDLRLIEEITKKRGSLFTGENPDATVDLPFPGRYNTGHY